ncbi:unnamed protein product, partial [Didymodactylos carnosus]
LKEFDLNTVTVKDLSFATKFQLEAKRNDFVHAVVSYFTVEFSKCHKYTGFSTSPECPYTHWKQVLFYFDEDIMMHKGEKLNGSFALQPNPKNDRDLDFEIDFHFKAVKYSNLQFKPNQQRFVSRDTISPKPLAPNKDKAADFDNYFQDEIEIRFIGGRGGDGMSSFSRGFQNEFGGPNGGDGGNGAHIILQELTSLNHLQNMYIADNGEPGMSSFMKGRSAEHLVIEIPVGTLVKTANGDIVAELSRHEQKFVVARGGLGGKGNAYFLSNMNRAPSEYELGANGDKKKYILELQLIAHFGLLGFPNAGKSSILRAISRARPIVGDYEFTTLYPQVGTVIYDDFVQIYVADIPGIIQGASKQQQGLGTKFLRHIERCLGLLYVIDMSIERPWEQFDLLSHEIREHNETLSRKPITVIANKIDDEDGKRQLEETRKRIPHPLLPISTTKMINIDKFLVYLRKLHDELVTDDWRAKFLDT